MARFSVNWGAIFLRKSCEERIVREPPADERPSAQIYDFQQWLSRRARTRLTVSDKKRAASVTVGDFVGRQNP